MSENIFTVPRAAPFLKTVAQSVLSGALWPTLPNVADRLGDAILILPTERAVKALQAQFLNLEENVCARILPRMLALGSVEPVRLASLGITDGALLKGAFETPAAIAPAFRQLLLARLILAWSAREVEKQRLDFIGSTPGDALSLAKQLATLMDEFGHHQIPADALKSILPEDYQVHWQLISSFLRQVVDAWPQVLAATGSIDPVERQRRTLSILIEALAHEAIDHPIAMIGSAGEQPIARDLIGAIAAYSKGAVVLCALDRATADVAWNDPSGGVIATPSHPQHAHAILLAQMQVERDGVLDLWPQSGQGVSVDPILDIALLPANYTDEWRDFLKSAPETIERSWTLVEAQSPFEEAKAIALLLRQTADIKGHRSALVTPDRALARRVKKELERWALEVDDTAGAAMLQTPVGVFFTLLMDVVASQFSAVPLLALLKHPLMVVPGLREDRDEDRLETRLSVRFLEEDVLRGPRIGPGLGNIQRVLNTLLQEDQDRDEPNLSSRQRLERVQKLLTGLETLFEPILKMQQTGVVHGFCDWLLVHLALVRKVEAARKDDSLFQHDDALALTDTIEDIAQAAQAVQFDLSLTDYIQVVRQMMQDKPVRSRRPKHPDILIMGPLEARLLPLDTVVLGGLVEGTWPRAARSDPWLSRPMRSTLALPSPEFEIGLSAQDFQQLFAAKHVAMTRSAKLDGSPTVPSRWVQRLFAVLPQTQRAEMVERGAKVIEIARALDRPTKAIPPKRPLPKPDQNLRPRKYPVTTIEQLALDPYSVFARNVLRLKRIDGLDEPPDARDKGTLIHDALHHYMVWYQQAGHHDFEVLRTIGKSQFEVLDPFPAVKALWWPRFEAIAHWFIETEISLGLQKARCFTEIAGAFSLGCDHGTVTVSARADRIDLLDDNRARLVDYKTGTAPSQSDVDAGARVQLPIEAVIINRGGFSMLPSGIKASDLVFYELKGRDGANAMKSRWPKNADIDLAHAQFEEIFDRSVKLICASLSPQWPYRAAVHYDDDQTRRPYAHLSRMDAWIAAGAEEETDIDEKGGLS